jgi:hypothetical protein
MASELSDRLIGSNNSKAVKAPCIVATTANITLSGEQTVNGVALKEANTATGLPDRVVVKDQTTTTENGIYNVSTGAWTRAPDFDGNNDIVDGTLVNVDASGTIDSSTTYRVVLTNPAVIGTSAITFVKNADLSSVTASDSVFLVGDGTDFVGESGDTARISLGVGSTQSPAFAALGITGLATVGDLTLSADNPEILGGDVNGILHMSSSTSTALGAAIRLHGNSHASLANDIGFYGSNTVQLYYDESASSWNFQANAITLGGVVTQSDATDTTSGSSGSIKSAGGIGAIKDIFAGGTFKTSGDISASDAAAMGYSSAQGLKLIGTGSTDDVSIYNTDAAKVLSIATGTDDVTFADDLLLSSGAVINFHAGDVTVTHSANTLTFAGGTVATAAITCSTIVATGTTTVVSTDGGSAIGPLLVIDRNSSSAADADFIGALYFKGRNDNGTPQEVIYASLEAQIDDMSDGTEDGSLILKNMVNGSLTTILDISSGGVLFAAPATPNSDDNAALGAAGVAWSDLFLASGSVVNFNSGDVTITHSTNALAFAGATGGYSFDGTTTVASADGGSAIGPLLVIDRNSASAADADFIGALYFRGRNDNGTPQEVIYSSLESQIDDASDGSEDGSLLVKTMLNGTLTTFMDISSGGVLFSTPIAPNSNDNATLGASGTAWSDLFLASGGVVNFNSGDVTVTHATNTLAFAGATGGYSFDDDLVMASGKGIDFSATANSNAGMTSEIFDDYEEGVYTATIVCASSGSYTLNSSYDTLSYTKVGNIVKVQGLIAISGESSPSGALRLNCPTTAASQTELSGRSQSSVIWEGQGATWAGQTYMVVNAGNAFATFYYQSDAGAETAVDDGEVDTSFNIMVNFWYTSA